MTNLIYTRDELKKIICSFIKTNSKGRIDVKTKIDLLIKEQIILSTEGCRDERFSERIFWILNDIYVYPTCVECGKQFKPRYYGLGGTENFNERRFCSNKCLTSNEKTKEKRKETNLQIYGVENVSQNNEIKIKINDTILQRFGVENVSQSVEIREKIKYSVLQRFGVENVQQHEEIKQKTKETNLERYGVECSCNIDIENNLIKSKKTNLERYGVEYIFQCIEIRQRIKQTNLQKYGVEYIFQSYEMREKVKKTNLERYGVENPMQNAEIFNKNILNCKKNKYMILPSGKEISYQRI